MNVIRSILKKALRARSVKFGDNTGTPPTNIPIAVRPITGLNLAPMRLVKRWTIAAMLGARKAVRANIPEIVYLRTQHAIYRSTAPHDVTAPIPDTSIDPATGELLVHPPADQRHPIDTVFDASLDVADLQSPVAAEAAFQRNASQAAGNAVAIRLEELEDDRRTVERQLRDTDEQLDRIGTEQNTSAAARAKAAEEGATELNAPAAGPSLMRIVLWRLFEIVTIAGESMVSFFALANSGGLDPSNLAVEFANGAALSIIGWAFAALTISSLLFVITEWAFARIGAVVEDVSDPTRAFRLTTGIAALIFVTAVVAAIACLRVQLGSAEKASVAAACIFFIVGAAPLIGGALVHIHANALTTERGDARRVVATPRAADVAQRLRTEHEEALIAQRDRLRARRDQITAAIQLLNAQMHGAEQAVRDVARHETRVVLQWIDSLRAGLAKDQKYFEQYARAWNNRMHLLAVQPLAPSPGTLVPMRKRRTP